MALGGSMSWISPWPWVAEQATHTRLVLNNLRLSSSASLHSAKTFPLVFLSHLSTTYLLLVMLGLIPGVYTCLTYSPALYLEVRGHLHLSMQAERLESEDSAPGLGTVPGRVWMN